MKYRQIKSIIINDDLIEEADHGSGDRLGWICQIELSASYSGDYGAYGCLRMLGNVIRLLSEHYREIIEFGEHNDCWIYWREESKTIEILHKYWSYRELSLFREIMIAMSHAHGWELNLYGGVDACMAMSQS